jgi:hypothetical protein
MNDFSQMQKLVPKTIHILQQLIELYDKKSRGEVVRMPEILHVLEGVEKTDILWALSLMRQLKQLSDQRKPIHGSNTRSTRPISNEQLINEGGGMALPGHSSQMSQRQTAQALLQMLFQTSQPKSPFPKANQLLDQFQIQDTDARQEFAAQYEQLMKKTKTAGKKFPVETNLLRWAWLGKFFFYGGIVLFILIILHKIMERFLRITTPVLLSISNFFRPLTSRFSRPKADGKGNIRVNIVQNAPHKKVPSAPPLDDNSDLETSS